MNTMAEVPEESKVKYNFLGKSGVKVANICMGTMTFGKGKLDIWRQTNEMLSHQILDRYAQWGGNFIDTADIYSSGKAETFVGSWLQKQEREKFLIASKCGFPTDRSNPNSVGLSRRHLITNIECSLKRLNTDYIDLYYMHKWDDATPQEETLRTFDDLVRCGKIRYIGINNTEGWQAQRLVDLTQHMGLNSIICLQQQYSLVSRQSEKEAFRVCKNHGIAVLPWSPLKAGLLTGVYRRDTRPHSGRLGWVAQSGINEEPWPAWESLIKDDQIWKTLERIEEMAPKYGKSMAQISLRWLLQKDIVPSVVIGCTNISELDENMGAANGWTISLEDMAELDEVSAPASPYPYRTFGKQTRNNPFNSSSFLTNTSG